MAACQLASGLIVVVPIFKHQAKLASGELARVITSYYYID